MVEKVYLNALTPGTIGAIDMPSDPKIVFILNFKFLLMYLLNWLAIC